MPTAGSRDVKEQTVAKLSGSGSSAVAVVKTIEEHVQLVRVFRLLAFEIPLQLVDRKLERLSEKIRVAATPGERGSAGGSNTYKRKSSTEYEAKYERYMREKNRFLVTLQEETSNGRELVCSKFQISADALMALMEQLSGSPTVLTKSHIEELIWEVNDSLDGMVSFEEFEQSYMRARSDRTGLEPSELFFITGFLMYDKERSGRIVLDNAMKIFYLKYGDMMEREMEIHFGSKLNEGAQFILFPEFYNAIMKRAGELIDQQASISKSNKYCKRL